MMQKIMNFKTIKLLLPILLTILPFQLQTYAQTKGWGKNLNGELGIGTLTIERSPLTIPSMSDAIGISGGYDHTLILQPNGTIMSTGSNLQGQLGDGTTTRRTTPVATSGLTNIRSVSGSGLFSSALRSDGTVWAWGANFFGQLGNGTLGSSQRTPTQTTISNVIQIEDGFSHNLALKSDGTVWSWGENEFGQLGNNSTTNSLLPVQVGVGVTGFENIIAVSAGNLHSMALKSDGTVWVWGGNNRGQVGNGSSGENQLIPVQNTTLTNIVQISAARGHNLALKLDGTVWVWGFNGDGQVGNGVSGDDQLTPVQNTTVSNIIEIETGGGSSSYVRRKDGAIFSWGYNFFGSIGDGTSNNRLTPFQVPIGAGYADIAAEDSAAFALKPVFSATTGTNQGYYGHNFSMVFDNIITGGDVSVTAIDPTTTGLPLPSGYNIQPLQPAYDLTKTATTAGNIKVCIKVNETNPANYPFLRIMHEESGALLDRTTSFSAAFGEVCATVTSFSKFVVATVLVPTAANVSVTGKVQTSNGRGISRAVVSITNSIGEIHYARTNQFGYFRFNEIIAGENYVFIVNAKGYSFVPQVLNITEDLTGLNFMAQQFSYERSSQAQSLTFPPILF